MIIGLTNCGPTSAASLGGKDSKTRLASYDELLMDRTTLTRGLNILIKEGLIQQSKTKDSRKKIMKLTEKGHQVLDKAIPLWIEAENEILDETKKLGFSVI